MAKIRKQRISIFQEKLIAWYQSNGRTFPWRKEGLDAYQIIIAEALLQRTKAETVAKFYEAFLIKFPDWNTLSKAQQKKIETFLKPVGLYRQRAKRMAGLAKEMVKRKGVLPTDREELEQIPFLGQYIANAIELQIFKQPSPLIDVNMSRVLERYFGERKLADIRYDPYLQKLAYKVSNHPKAKELNWAVLDFAALTCKAIKPLCETCVLKAQCKFYKANGPSRRNTRRGI